MLLWIAVLLPSFILATDTNWQYQIYVSSSDGTNSSSCWNGAVPCNTLNLALQGVQHNSTVIYLYPGIYTLDHEVQVRNVSRVAIIGLSDDVTISCQPLNGQWLDNVIFHCITFYNCPTTISNSIPCPYNVAEYGDDGKGNDNKLLVDFDSVASHPGQHMTFTASLYDRYSDREYIMKNSLTVCIVSGPESVKLCTNSSCTNTSINSFNQYSLSFCYFGQFGEKMTTIDINVTVFTSDVSTNITLSVLTDCRFYHYYNCYNGYYSYNGYYNYGCYINATSGKCECSDSPGLAAPLCFYSPYLDTRACAKNRTGTLCGSCEKDYSVPINLPTECVQCDPLIGWILFVTVQLLPVTVMVLLMIVLNIQLTSGSINALVFYSQILTTVYPGLTSNIIFGTSCYNSIYLIPFNIFNLDFTLFLADYPLCILSATTPLEALSFWYVIGLHPLVLLLLLYVWITLYDKGYKVIVLITRPIHRLLARFWRMTNIEPSLPHSIASIYLLCFMQLAATSFKLLHFSITYDGQVAFFNDGTLGYFGWPHCLAGIFAILVLILLVLIPMLYIQLYPFKPFHKLLECLHLNNWQILASLGDVFTGPYKNGTTNKLDYRYFAGFYFLLRIIILLLHFIPLSCGLSLTAVLQVCLFFLHCGTVMTFRPYKRNVNNFIEFFIFLLLAIFSLLKVVHVYDRYVYNFTISLTVFSFDCFFVLILFVYFIYWTVKKIRSCYGYCRPRIHKPLPNITSDEDLNDAIELIDDKDWIADRMTNPQNYNEVHFSYNEEHFSTIPYQLKDEPAT